LRQTDAIRETGPVTMPGADERIRVLTMVDLIGTQGGGETMARSVTMRLDPERFERTFCVTRWDREFDAPSLGELADAGVHFLGLERDSRFTRAPWQQLLAYLRENHVDVMHTHKLGSNAWGAFLRRWSKVPVLIAQEHGVTEESARRRVLLDGRLIAPRVDAFVAVCEADKRRLIDETGVPAEKVRVIRNGIVADPPHSDRAAMRAELGIPADAPVVGALSMLRAEKALDVLIDAAALLAQKHPALTVLIVGGPASNRPEVADELRALADARGVADTVRFLGLRGDATDVLTAFDVAVLCSDREAGPLAILEYMEAAKPVVATRVGGIPEIVEDGQTGILVEPRDPMALAEAISALLEDRELAERYGAAGRERRLREFDLDQTVRKFEDLYRELLQDPAGADGA
jgi:glycosyltransferase involved in cell wall biosynthesis